MDAVSVPAELLSEAVLTWTGWGRTTWPAQDERLVIERFGNERAAGLLPMIRQLEDDFYRSDARFATADLAEMGDAAAAEFRIRHPEVSDAAVRALAWCYTFDYK
ncbi:hypothetical protein [Micromonospora sp. NPDC050495]|uniref:hypothetical protein n=1 Tax=Micromonospora sp. NPDC050495 TaxID=3154936 RepID=UPI0033E4E227